MTRCGICDEHYDLGDPYHACRSCRANGFVDNCQVGLTYYPDGEYAYWRHTRESARHQRVLALRDQTRLELLNRLNPVINEARAHQKLMRNPALAPLRGLFR